MSGRAFLLAAMIASAAPATAAERKTGQRPESGIEATVTVGTPLLEKYDMVAVTVPRLRDDLKVPLGIQGQIVVPSGAQFRVVREKPLKACTVAEDTYVDHFVGPRGAACLQDADGDGAFDKASAESVMFTTKKIQPPAPYDLTDAPAAAGSDYFRQTLVYLGAAQGVLRLSYREFSHDMARPAFTEELTFPLEATYPQTIAWRDTRITLLGVSNAGLRYRVESGQ
ncbi:hypothetical protein [Sphingobium yanoikuyae]|uniref:hypothetical protein n=1 Tax=Sphingobium yanoikuyae TaxID=13690 RepID=UPI0004E3C8D9|nr:hypothetical protein [Sphingobium yanoikuyae]KFD26144.1 hypothetical protein IH86_21530 [Sphingobium yanoikuyae]MDV3480854.1 hypothetical protein [Sphingobium yanoikuyae]